VTATPSCRRSISAPTPAARYGRAQWSCTTRLPAPSSTRPDRAATAPNRRRPPFLSARSETLPRAHGRRRTLAQPARVAARPSTASIGAGARTAVAIARPEHGPPRARQRAARRARRRRRPHPLSLPQRRRRRASPLRPAILSPSSSASSTRSRRPSSPSCSPAAGPSRVRPAERYLPPPLPALSGAPAAGSAE
jgi:hypothetical protein